MVKYLVEGYSQIISLTTGILKYTGLVVPIFVFVDFDFLHDQSINQTLLNKGDTS